MNGNCCWWSQFSVGQNQHFPWLNLHILDWFCLFGLPPNFLQHYPTRPVMASHVHAVRSWFAATYAFLRVLESLREWSIDGFDLCLPCRKILIILNILLYIYYIIIIYYSYIIQSHVDSYEYVHMIAYIFNYSWRVDFSRISTRSHDVLPVVFVGDCTDIHSWKLWQRPWNTSPVAVRYLTHDSLHGRYTSAPNPGDDINHSNKSLPWKMTCCRSLAAAWSGGRFSESLHWQKWGRHHLFDSHLLEKWTLRRKLNGGTGEKRLTTLTRRMNNSRDDSPAQKRWWLVGGFKHFSFSIIYGIILPIA